MRAVRAVAQLLTEAVHGFGLHLRPTYYIDGALEEPSLALRSAPPPDAPGEIRLFACVRNEALRLPYFLEHYRRLGVDRFFFVDNDSTDATAEILTESRNTHVFHTAQAYGKSGCGHLWLERLLGLYGAPHWSLIADADELLVYPQWRVAPLRTLCAYLDSRRFTAFPALLADVYGAQSIRASVYAPGSDPSRLCPFLDSATYRVTRRYWLDRRQDLVVGGMRSRVFGSDAVLNKIPLFKVDGKLRITQGAHLAIDARVADVRGLIVHSKFLHDFARRAEEEAARGEHWQGGREYQVYNRVMSEKGDVHCHYDGAVRIADEGALVRLGLLKTSRRYQTFLRNAPGPKPAREGSIAC